MSKKNVSNSNTVESLKKSIDELLKEVTKLVKSENANLAPAPRPRSSRSSRR
jgi:hypothetical protein